MLPGCIWTDPSWKNLNQASIKNTNLNHDVDPKKMDLEKKSGNLGRFFHLLPSWTTKKNAMFFRGDRIDKVNGRGTMDQMAQETTSKFMSWIAGWIGGLLAFLICIAWIFEGEKEKRQKSDH